MGSFFYAHNLNLNLNAQTSKIATRRPAETFEVPWHISTFNQ